MRRVGGVLKEYVAEVAVLVACAITTVWLFRTGHNNHAETGTFVVLSITLAVLISYARDTNRMARVALAKWERESRPRGRYSMDMADLKKEPYSDRVMFALINPSDLILKAKVWCNFQVYGQRVIGDEGFEGNTVWLLLPEQTSTSWFEIDPLLAKVGKNVAAMRSETSMSNRTVQLTMDLEMEFRDELGGSYRPPARRHFFEFASGRWIPVLTSVDPTW